MASISSSSSCVQMPSVTTCSYTGLLAAFQEASQPVSQQVVTEGICTQEELDEMLAIVASVRGN